MSRRLTMPLTCLLICVLVTAAVAATPKAVKDEYHRRTREVRRGSDPLGWLHLGTWVEQNAKVEKRDKERWIRYTRYQYGIAAKKKLADDDVEGWIRLAGTMGRLTGSDSLRRSYLAEALEKNPENVRLAQALGREEGGKAQASTVLWASRKAAAERAGTASAFRDLARWAADQRPHYQHAEVWAVYAHARYLYLSGAEGGPSDPIRMAAAEGERRERAVVREPREQSTPLPAFLGKRTAKNIRGEEARNGKLYRLEGRMGVRYVDALPTTHAYESVWKRGTRTAVKTISDTQIMMQSHPSWWQLKWDAEAKAWVEYTLAEERAARVRQIAYAKDRLQRARRRVAELTKELAERPKAEAAAKARAEQIARTGTRKASDFQRALGAIESGGARHQLQKTDREEAVLKVAAWERKLAELERAAREG